MVSMTQDKVVMNDQRLMYSISASVLYYHNYYKETYVMMQNQIKFMKDIYTSDFLKTLALSEVRKIENQKKFEIELEREKTLKQNLYFLIVFLVLILTIMIVFFQVRRNRKLIIKNNAIAKSDHEKQLLLKEIHHRVKNNFQIITSLVQLQAKNIKDPHALEVIKEGQNRIKSMALIHQKLYQQKGLLIDLKDYSCKLFKDINIMFSDCDVDVSIEIPDEYQIDIDTAIPLGLVLNELITNAFKYAFKPEHNNKFVIKLIKGNEFNQLVVSDNGKGSGVVDVNKENSIGIKLVSDLAKQLHGKLEVVKDNGTNFIVTFKETFQRELTE
jgi:two-component sensor histidine kinase